MRHLRGALLVDIDRDSRQMYAESLRQQDYDVDETEDGREALAKAIAHHPDIVITDTRLIGISGYDLCRLLKRDDATRAIPIVVVTGDGDPSDIDRAKHAGADAVLIKPCGAATVLGEVDRLIERSRTIQADAAASSERAADDTAKADDVLNGSQANRPVTLSRILYRRYTTTPPIAPPELRCPVCGRPLAYRRSHIGGVNARHVEQWDYFECPSGCGTFQCRQRTHKLRKVSLEP